LSYTKLLSMDKFNRLEEEVCGKKEFIICTIINIIINLFILFVAATIITIPFLFKPECRMQMCQYQLLDLGDAWFVCNISSIDFPNHFCVKETYSSCCRFMADCYEENDDMMKLNSIHESKCYIRNLKRDNGCPQNSCTLIDTDRLYPIFCFFIGALLIIGSIIYFIFIINFICMYTCMRNNNSEPRAENC